MERVELEALELKNFVCNSGVQLVISIPSPHFTPSTFHSSTCCCPMNSFVRFSRSPLEFGNISNETILITQKNLQ